MSNDVNKARIKLAEAMGWLEHGDNDIWRLPPSKMWVNVTDLPDPFTDANDDYAVLEWMRDYTELTHDSDIAWPMINALGGTLQINYQIGNNARAACKILEIKR